MLECVKRDNFRKPIAPTTGCKLQKLKEFAFFFLFLENISNYGNYSFTGKCKMFPVLWKLFHYLSSFSLRNILQGMCTVEHQFGCLWQKSDGNLIIWPKSLIQSDWRIKSESFINTPIHALSGVYYILIVLWNIHIYNIQYYWEWITLFSYERRPARTFKIMAYFLWNVPTQVDTRCSHLVRSCYFLEICCNVLRYIRKMHCHARWLLNIS